MVKFDELTQVEQKDLVIKISKWLEPYTHDVIIRVINQMDRILNDGITINLLNELYDREYKESNEFQDSIATLMRDFDTFKDYDVHKHIMTHANSYRDIVYDMYISEH